MKPAVALTSTLLLLGLNGPSAGAVPEASSTGPATEPGVHPTLPWFALQLVPSPEIASGNRGAHFGLRWQLTPVLYSFGIHRRLSPWRFFVVEPVVRQSGSLELFVSPEYLAIEPELRDRFLLRAGLRTYYPLVQRGEYVSISLGSSYFRVAGQDSVAYEAGVYVLYGVLGVRVDYAPGHDAARWIASLTFRFF
jgi:hypothetical protein